MKIISIGLILSEIFLLINAQNQGETETLPFSTDVSRLLDIIINSLYTQKDIFLREAISNASDSLDKLRYLSITRPELLEKNPELNVKISVNSENKTLIIEDNGIGMTKQELIQNLGTIAHSGTSQFLQAVAKGGSMNLIGQFGVGFYSYFLVSNKVSVVCRGLDNEEQYIWESTASNSFTVTKDTEGPLLERGCKIIMHIKEDMKDYLELNKVKALATKYSEFINYPISMYLSKEVSKETVEEKKEQLPQELEETPTEEDKKKKTTTETVWNWEVINNTKAIWLRPIEEIEEDEYKKFYKAISKDYQDPMTWIHFKAEGEVEFTALLYVPKTASLDFYYQKSMEEKKSNLKLYVRRVLISDKFEELLPSYLSFVKGVVHSDDLPLNVSRETLQQLRILKTIKKKLVKKILERIAKYSKEKVDEEQETNEGLSEEQITEKQTRIQTKKAEMKKKFDQFWKEYSRNLKYGLIQDNQSKTIISEIIKFNTSFNDTKTLTSFDGYIQRMKPNQVDIYYIGGESIAQIEEQPIYRAVVNKGYEVLLMTDPIDEYCIQTLKNYNDKKLVNIGKSGFELPKEEADTQLLKKLNLYYKPLITFLQTQFTDQIQKVQISTDLHEDPMIVLGSEMGYSSNFEKIARAQAVAAKDERLSFLENLKKDLLINPYHPFIKQLLDKINNKETEKASEQASMLFDAAMLSSGYGIKEQSKFNMKLYKLLKQQYGVDQENDKVELDLTGYEEIKEKPEGETSEEIKYDTDSYQPGEEGKESQESQEKSQEEIKPQEEGAKSEQEETGEKKEEQSKEEQNEEKQQKENKEEKIPVDEDL